MLPGDLYRRSTSLGLRLPCRHSAATQVSRDTDGPWVTVRTRCLPLDRHAAGTAPEAAVVVVRHLSRCLCLVGPLPATAATIISYGADHCCPGLRSRDDGPCGSGRRGLLRTGLNGRGVRAGSVSERLVRRGRLWVDAVPAETLGGVAIMRTCSAGALSEGRGVMWLPKLAFPGGRAETTAISGPAPATTRDRRRPVTALWRRSVLVAVAVMGLLLAGCGAVLGHLRLLDRCSRAPRPVCRRSGSCRRLGGRRFRMPRSAPISLRRLSPSFRRPRSTRCSPGRGSSAWCLSRARGRTPWCSSCRSGGDSGSASV